jgi:hypothetical protein
VKQINPFDLYVMLQKVPVVQIVKRDGRLIKSHDDLGPTFGPNIYPEIGPLTRGTIIEIDGEPHEITTTVPPITTEIW